MRLRDWINAPEDDWKWEKRPARVRYLARACGVTRQTIYGWIKGEFKPTLERAVLLERATGGAVTPADLLDDEDGDGKGRERAVA